MLIRERNPIHHDLTVAQARTMRAEQAGLTAFYADRAAQAGATAQFGPLAYWRDEYRRSTARCRMLGDLIRGERAADVKLDRPASSTVVRLAPPNSAPDSPPTGEAA